MKLVTMHIEPELIREFDSLLGTPNSDVRKRLRGEFGRDNAGRGALIRLALRFALDHNFLDPKGENGDNYAM
jgi:hypothetical protein